MDEEDAFAPYMEEYGIDPLSPPLNQNQNSSVQQGMFQAHGAGRFRSGSSGTKGFLRRDFISRNQQEFNGDGFRDGNDSILSSPTPTAQSISRMDPSSVSYSHPTNNFRPASISSYQKPNSQSQSHSHSGIRALPMPSQMQNRNHPISRTIKSNLPSSNRISTSNGFQKPALGLNARILDHTRLESTQGREVVARMEADVEDYFGDGDGFEEALMNDVPDIVPVAKHSRAFGNENSGSQSRTTNSNGTRATSNTKLGVKLRHVGELPDMYRSIFKFGVFNAVQSTCFDTIYHSDSNTVVSAPTGAGKTVLFELAMLRLFSTSETEGKCVYLAPTKSLCGQKAKEWKGKFERLGGITVIELTGDSFGSLKDVGSARIIVTTPEKWDAMTRRWHSHSKLLNLISLVCIDEVHMVGENVRGAVLEAIVTRIKTLGTHPRFVAVSATIPNVEDIAMWLSHPNNNDGSDEKEQVAERFEFGEAYRPCKLSKIVKGYNFGDNEWSFRAKLNSKMMEIITEHSSGKPVLIFCPTRKNCSECASTLSKAYQELLSRPNRSKLPWPRPSRSLNKPQDTNLAKFLEAGVAFHHAGLDMSDRAIVEQGFLDGSISILCCTSTLAVGVNLPARMVIIAGTKKYDFSKGNVDYSDLELLQMMGRAGRPQFDTLGVAFIATDYREQSKYEKLVNCQTVLESGLHKSLTEHLNSEIALRTITSIDTALIWLHSTFLFIRIGKNPSYYSLSGSENVSPSTRLEEICVESVKNLVAGGIIDESVIEDDTTLASTVFGDMMSKYYLSLPTLLALKDAPPRLSMRALLELVSASSEFNDFRFRAGEKKLYSKVNKELKFACAQVSTGADKVNILIQAVLQGIPSSELRVENASNPAMEIFSLWTVLTRILKCVLDLSLENTDAYTTKYALELLRSVNCKAWEGSAFILRQLEGIGEKSVKIFSEKGINTLDDVKNCDPARLEILVNRNPPFGTKLVQQAQRFPKLSIEILKTSEQILEGAVRVNLKITLSLLVTKPPPTLKKGDKKLMGSCLLLTSDGEWIEFRRTRLETFLEGGQSFTVSVDLVKPSQRIIGTFDCDEIAGVGSRVVCRTTTASSAYPTPAVGQSDEAENAIDLMEEAAPVAAPKVIASAVEIEGPSEKYEPVLLSNGQYACNHRCADKNKCRHLCCREGTPKPPRPPKSKSNKISESGNSVSRKKSQTSKKEEVVNSFDQLEGNKLDRPPIRAHRILPQSIEDPPELKFAKQPGQDRFKAVIENKDDEEELDELESSPAPSPPIRAIIKKQIKKKSTPAIEPVNSSSNSPSPPPKKLKAPRSKAPVIDSTIQNNFNLDPLLLDSPPQPTWEEIKAHKESERARLNPFSDSDLEMEEIQVDRTTVKRAYSPDEVVESSRKSRKIDAEIKSTNDKPRSRFKPNSKTSSSPITVEKQNNVALSSEVEMKAHEEEDEEEEEEIFGQSEFKLLKNCEAQPVVQKVTESIKTEPDDDFDDWFENNVVLID